MAKVTQTLKSGGKPCRFRAKKRSRVKYGGLKKKWGGETGGLPRGQKCTRKPTSETEENRTFKYSGSDMTIHREKHKTRTKRRN